MLPPKALEGAFVEGATMLQILLLLLGLIVEDIDLGKEERTREGKLGEGLRWLTVHAGCLTYKLGYLSAAHTHSLQSQ